MNIQNKTCCLVVTGICLVTLSLSVQAGRSFSSSTGRSASASAGSRSATSANGGSATWNRGSGTTVTTAGGRTASTSATAHSAPGMRAPAYGYRPPVPAYGYRPPPPAYGYSSGQVAAAGVAGLAVGAMAGAAAANSSQPSSSTVVVQQPASSSIPVGTNLNDLPAGCNSVMINSVQYFQCGSSWMRAYSGYYQVVPSPY